MIQAPKVMRERSTPWRVFVSWNDGRSWWEVMPELWRGTDVVDPRVTIEYFTLPQGNFESR